MEKTYTDANFEAEVLKADKPVLVDFWAPWCGPCKMMAPTIEQIAKELDGKVLVGKMNVDESNTYAQQFGIMSIPTFLIFKDGKVVEQMIGVMDKEDMKEKIVKYI
ncbi:MAG: thioredoxin [Patescibacteria group bacterium]